MPLNLDWAPESASLSSYSLVRQRFRLWPALSYLDLESQTSILRLKNNHNTPVTNQIFTADKKVSAKSIFRFSKNFEGTSKCNTYNPIGKYCKCSNICGKEMKRFCWKRLLQIVTKRDPLLHTHNCTTPRYLKHPTYNVILIFYNNALFATQKVASDWLTESLSQATQKTHFADPLFLQPLPSNRYFPPMS